MAPGFGGGVTSYLHPTRHTAPGAIRERRIFLAGRYFPDEQIVAFRTAVVFRREARYVATLEHDNEGSIRILIIDDHRFFRELARQLIETDTTMLVVGEAATAAAARALMQTRPDVVVLDLDLGDTDGLELLAHLLKANRHSRFLIVSGMSDSGIYRQALREGAMGVVRKSGARSELVAAIRHVHLGMPWIGGMRAGAAVDPL